MKRVSILLILVSIGFTGISYSQSSLWRVGVEGIYSMPYGTFSQRFLPSQGFRVIAQESHDNYPRWGVFVERLSFTRPNEEKLFITRKDTVQNILQEFQIPLKPFSMELNSAGAGLLAEYNLFHSSLVDINAKVGFGLHYWKYHRDAYFDTVKVDTGAGALKLNVLDVIQVPEFSQHDWSGGLELGLNTEFILFSPFSIFVGGSYKILLAELWPALKLDMENVSGMQMFQGKIGITYLIE